MANPEFASSIENGQEPVLGASAVVRWASQRGAPAGSWLAGMLARKPEMLVTVASANKTARMVWALLVKDGVYRAPVGAA